MSAWKLSFQLKNNAARVHVLACAHACVRACVCVLAISIEINSRETSGPGEFGQEVALETLTDLTCFDAAATRHGTF